MSSPKSHHYVPRFILANFVGSDGKLWVMPVAGGRAWSAVPENVYVELHRYSSIDDAGNRNAELELAYSRLEGATAPVVAALLEAARAGCPPALDDAQLATWSEFLYHQIKRVPAVTEALARRSGWSERLDVALRRIRDSGLDVDEEEVAALRSTAGLARLTQNATVKALSTDSPLVTALLRGAAVELGVAPAGTSFVIGSYPIAGFRSGLLQAARLSAPMWFPVAPDVAVRLAFGGQPRTVALTPAEVASINEDSRDQSEYVAGASSDLVKAVVASRAPASTS